MDFKLSFSLSSSLLSYLTLVNTKNATKTSKVEIVTDSTTVMNMKVIMEEVHGKTGIIIKSLEVDDHGSRHGG